MPSTEIFGLDSSHSGKPLADALPSELAETISRVYDKQPGPEDPKLIIAGAGILALMLTHDTYITHRNPNSTAELVPPLAVGSLAIGRVLRTNGFPQNPNFHNQHPTSREPVILLDLLGPGDSLPNGTISVQIPKSAFPNLTFYSELSDLPQAPRFNPNSIAGALTVPLQ